MKLYHYTQRQNLQSILEKGLLPGSVIGKGERIGAVLFDSEPYKVKTGNFVYLEVEIPDNALDLHQLNGRWWAYAAAIHPSQITAIANPPKDVDTCFRIFKEKGKAGLDESFTYREVRA